MESETVLLMRDRVTELRRQIAVLRADVAAREFELHQAEAALTLMIGIKPSGAQASMSAIAHFARQKNPEIAKLTIKELALKALHEHLWNGATSNQLIEVFVHKWGRDDIARTSLSPQLTRLKEEGMITLQGRQWFLAEGYYSDPDLERDAMVEAEADAEALNKNGGAKAPPNADEAATSSNSGRAQEYDL